MEKIFTESDIRLALLANGFYEIHAKDNWVHESDISKDYCGVSLMEAFGRLLRERNII